MTNGPRRRSSRPAGRQPASQWRSAAAAHRCARYQADLLEFADRRVVAPELRAALDHLEECARCERELASTALVLNALRRLAGDAQAVEPSPRAWQKISAALQDNRQSGNGSHMRGLVAGLALLLVVLLPSAPWRGTQVLEPTVPVAATMPADWFIRNPAPRGPFIPSTLQEKAAQPDQPGVASLSNDGTTSRILIPPIQDHVQ